MLLGPSGGGKSEVANLLARGALFNRVITCTTRSPRPGEVDDVDYHFITREEFTRHILNDDFAEYDISRTELYGTLHEDIRWIMSSAELPLLVMNVAGAETVVHDYPEALVFFLAVPLDQLISRLNLRDMSKESRRERISGLMEELRGALSPCVRFTINNENGHLLESVKTIREIVEIRVGHSLGRV